jgi:predicted secreted protein
MSLVTSLAIYFIIWWLVLFTVLPWGAGSHHERDEEVEPGNAPSAPVRPRLALKFAVTTAIAAVVFAFVYVVIEYDLIKLDDITFLPKYER